MAPFGTPDIEKLKAKRDVRRLAKAAHNHYNTQPIMIAAIEALGHVGEGDPRAYDALIGVLGFNDKLSWVLRANAAESLGMLKDARALEPLVTTLVEKGSNHHLVRISAARGLANLGDPRAVPTLQKIASTDTRPDVRVAAAQALVELGDSQGRTLLAKTFASHGGAGGALVMLSHSGVESTVSALRTVAIGPVMFHLLAESLEEPFIKTGELLSSAHFARELLQKLWAEYPTEEIRTALGNQLSAHLQSWVHPARFSLEGHKQGVQELSTVVRALGEQSIPIMADVYLRWLTSDESWSSGSHLEFMPTPASVLMTSAISEVLDAAVGHPPLVASPLPPLSEMERNQMIETLKKRWIGELQSDRIVEVVHAIIDRSNVQQTKLSDS